MPLVTPALSALAIFTFLGNWTAFFWPLIVTTSSELYTLPIGLMPVKMMVVRSRADPESIEIVIDDSELGDG